MNKITHSDLDMVADFHFDLVCPKLKKSKSGRDYSATAVMTHIEEKIVEYKGKNGLAVFTFFKDRIEDILVGKPNVLDKIIRDFEKKRKEKNISLYTGKGKPNKLFLDIKYCFNYSSFSGSNKPYQLLNKLQLSVCPYCNRQFVNTFHSEDGKTRATLDHFYSQEKFPFLALSFYNLIPACYSCNSSLKGRKAFSNKNNINPYNEGFSKDIKFSISYKAKKGAQRYITEFYADENNMEITLKCGLSRYSVSYKKAKGNIKTFKILELYNLHKDFVLELLQKEVIYNKAGYAKNLAKNFPKIFNNQDEVLRMLLGNYVNPDDFNKRPFSRLVHDISEELGLTKRLTI